jgi:hypothetical protein
LRPSLYFLVVRGFWGYIVFAELALEGPAAEAEDAGGAGLVAVSFCDDLAKVLHLEIAQAPGADGLTRAFDLVGKRYGQVVKLDGGAVRRHGSGHDDGLELVEIAGPLIGEQYVLDRSGNGKIATTISSDARSELASDQDGIAPSLPKRGQPQPRTREVSIEIAPRIARLGARRLG